MSLVQIIRDLAALKTISIVDNMEDIVLFAYLGDVDDFVGCSWREAASRAEDAEDLLRCHSFNCSIDLGKIRNELLAVDLWLDHQWLQIGC